MLVMKVMLNNNFGVGNQIDHIGDSSLSAGTDLKLEERGPGAKYRRKC